MLHFTIMQSSRLPLSRFVALGALILAACGGSTPLDPAADCPWRIGDVCGEWLLVGISGGVGFPPEPPDDARLLLRPDSTYTMSEPAGEVTGSYRIFWSDDLDNIWSDSIWLADFHPETDTAPGARLRVRLRGSDALQFNELYYDGFQYDYERVGHR